VLVGASGHLHNRPTLLTEKENPVPINLEAGLVVWTAWTLGRRAKELYPDAYRKRLPRIFSLYPSYNTDCAIPVHKVDADEASIRILDKLNARVCTKFGKLRME
jgi:hypothetical protein